ncbi:protein of unknown function [Burkholderia multivorans]
MFVQSTVSGLRSDAITSAYSAICRANPRGAGNRVRAPRFIGPVFLAGRHLRCVVQIVLTNVIAHLECRIATRFSRRTIFTFP